ncbi:myb-like protein X [Penaeus japonicus]|uniref:myb-like protein X n=1 Tax=Penaeus japonicus TaxID=27405 RepID=UPI001C70D969|nr:myb-like protein X [Penaeus japonicus]
MGDISRVVSRSGRRTAPTAHDSLTALICRKLRESGQDDEFLQSVMAALSDLGQELSRCPSRKASIKLARRTLSRAVSDRKRNQRTAEDAQDKEGAKPEELAATIVQVLEEELNKEEQLEGKEGFQGEEKERKNEGEEEEEEEKRQAEGGFECGEDVPDHKAKTGPPPPTDDPNRTSEEQQPKEDSHDAQPPMFVIENKMVDGKAQNTRDETILHNVRIQYLSKNHSNSCSLSHFYLEEDAHTTSVKLVMENNKCTLYKIDNGIRTHLGVFHADHLKTLRNGFEVTLNTQLTSDTVDNGMQPKDAKRRKREEPVMLTVPEDQQEEYKRIFAKMRKSFMAILFG